ncbi:hypothetical protein ATHL_01002 [Anaerolinea thermolimosa]|uniref:hypothetical protein n=1 Tax=Anaerolinea thermolimosa TaxID=229919 RepID=UPI00078362BC|nr:hypothetical protein [Anaerolinea thermolimosa]GAP06156.1 hypothetical protein ATHL_01002 [Anaerolinea thermolimosa]
MFWLDERIEERLRKKLENFYTMSFCSHCEMMFPMAEFVVVPRCPHCKSDAQTSILYTDEDLAKVMPVHFSKLARLQNEFMSRIVGNPIEMMKLRVLSGGQRSMNELLEDYLINVMATPGEWVLKLKEE